MQKINDINSAFEELYPIQRSLLGDEFDLSIKLLENGFEFDKNYFKSGTKVFDWTVPKGWKLKKMCLTDKSGRVIWSNEMSNLGTIFHSSSFKGWISGADLRSKMHISNTLPESVPYKTAYYTDEWGLCVPKRIKTSITDDMYYLEIDAQFYDSQLCVAEFYIKGASDTEILFTSYLCHPSMANNELSGPVTISFLIQHLLEEGYEGEHSLRFVLFPETIGALAFLSLRGEHLKRKLISGYVLTCIGDKKDIGIKLSHIKDSKIDSLSVHALSSYFNKEINVDKFEPFGSDERQFNSPYYRLPVSTLFRSKFGEYDEYHTDADNLELIDSTKIQENILFLTYLIKTHNMNIVYARYENRGELHLSKYDLYEGIGASVEKKDDHILIAWFMHLVNGQRSLWDISSESEIIFDEVARIAKICLDKGIIYQIK